jgi:hypothetical protein
MCVGAVQCERRGLYSVQGRERDGAAMAACGEVDMVLARPPARERVWRDPAVSWCTLVKGEGERGPGSTALVDARSCPMHVGARPVPGGGGSLSDQG